MADFDAESYLAQLTTRPGVYQMFDSHGELLYVGKAKNLKNLSLIHISEPTRP